MAAAAAASATQVAQLADASAMDRPAAADHGAAGRPVHPRLRDLSADRLGLSVAVARFALAPGGFTLTFVGLPNFRKLLARRAAVPLPRHLQSRRPGRRGSSCIIIAGAAGRARPAALRRRQRHRCSASSAASYRRALAVALALARRSPRSCPAACPARFVTTLLLRRRRRDRAVPARARPGAPLRHSRSAAAASSASSSSCR